MTHDNEALDRGGLSILCVPVRGTRLSTPQPGMGAVPTDHGVTFRVWAPNATSVNVAGDFNDWSDTAAPLESEENGYWSAHVPAAEVGQEYRYMIRHADELLSRIDPYARQVTSSIGNGVIYDPHAFDWGADAFTIPPWNELVLYELYVGTFNAVQDGMPGTLASAADKLSYLQDLGINAIELMPMMEFPGDFSWGYNPSQPFAVESAYGGPDALKAFVKAAHEHGIAVIIDVVYNHFGPSDLDLWRFDGWSQDDGGGIYFYNDDRSETPWGATRPDYGRDAVRQYVRDNALMWLEEYRADGLRWDAVSYIKNVNGSDDPAKDLPDGWTLMQWVNDEIDRRSPGKISIAEDLKNNAWVAKRVSDGGAGFDTQWDAGFVHPARSVVTPPDDASRDLGALKAAILHRYDGDAFQRVIYTESHDEVANGRARVPEEIWPGHVENWFSRKRSTLGAALTLTSPGIPMLFQGQELLEDRWFHDRDPIDWERANAVDGILAMYRDLIALRRNQAGSTRGLCGQNVDVFHVDDEGKVLAFRRWDEGGPNDTVVVVVNLSNDAREGHVIGFPRGGLWHVRFNSDSRHYGDDFANHSTPDVTVVETSVDGLPCSAAVTVGPYTVVLFSQ